MRALGDEVTMRVRVDGKRPSPRSYLAELSDIAQGTGRRISAICQLRYEDLQLARTSSAPHGAIRWPGSTDKKGREWIAPIDVRARELEGGSGILIGASWATPQKHLPLG